MERNLIQVKENETVTTSLLVAEKFNKNHRDVLRKIESMISEIETGVKLRSLNFFEKSEHKDAHGQTRPMYFMNRDGFTLLAMGFTGKEALAWKLKYIEAFNEMEKKLHSPTLTDNRLELVRLISKAKDFRVADIKPMFPEYFSTLPEINSLEYISDINTSYRKWIEDLNITKDWIGDFPTLDIFNNYARYCIDNRLESMGKKTFYRTLENDFGLTRKQRNDGQRYFISA